MACGSSCGCNKPEEPEQPPRPKDASAFPFHSATYSLIAACVVIGLLRVSASQFRQGEDGQFLGTLAEAGGGMVALVGAIFAIIAIAHINKLGPDGLLGKGALGLMLNGGFLLIIATNLIAGRERARELTPALPSASQIRSEPEAPGSSSSRQSPSQETQ